MADPYQILGVAREATQDEIRKSYRVLAKKNHPDLHPGDKGAEARFKEIASAYAIVGDDIKRGHYDSGKIDGSGAEVQQPPPRESYRQHAEAQPGFKYERQWTVDGRFGQIQSAAEHQQGQPADNLDGVAPVFDGPGDRTDAERCTQSDQPVAQHRANARRDSTEKTTLNRALDAQHVDRADRSRHQHANDHADGNNQRIRDQLHQAAVSSPHVFLPPHMIRDKEFT